MDRGSYSVFVAVHNHTETITYKIQSRLWNEIFAMKLIGIFNRVRKVFIFYDYLKWRTDNRCIHNLFKQLASTLPCR